MAVLDELLKTTQHLNKQREPHDADSPILHAKSLRKVYDSGTALENLTFKVDKGERLAVVGPNGAGKSTLFKIIAGVETPSTGQVHIYGHSPGGHICIAYLTQRSQVDWSFPVTVADVVMMGRVGQLGLFRNPKSGDWQVVQEALEMVGMGDLSKRQINQLSGGQQQRMFIARALTQEAELMLLDEPFGGLDVQSQEEILQVLDDLGEAKVTVLVSLHDLRTAAEHFNRILLLNRKMLAIGTPQEVLKPDYLLAAYGGHLHMVTTEQGLLAVSDTCCDDEHV